MADDIPDSIRRCLTCGDEDVKFVARVGDYDKKTYESIGRDFFIVRCQKCRSLSGDYVPKDREGR